MHLQEAFKGIILATVLVMDISQAILYEPTKVYFARQQLSFHGDNLFVGAG